jgi:site-specific DNA recombinase
MKQNQKIAVLYARFSSDLQKDRSIDDQFSLCESYAKREGYKLAGRYSDRANPARRCLTGMSCSSS